MKKYLLCAVGLIVSLFILDSSFGHGMSEDDKHLMLTGGYLQYIWLGARHMLTGYDHLLFIFGVIFFLNKFSEIVKFITAFTLGHSITLIAATFMGLTANYYLVDAIIAVTVIYKGFDNIDGFRKYLKMEPPNMLVLVFIFGLIHGFGLSTRLQELPLGHDGLLLKIVSFNVGVELGQIVALSLMLVILMGWRKTSSFAKFSRAANIGLICAGFALLIYQLNGYMHERSHQSEVRHHNHADSHDNQHEHEHGHQLPAEQKQDHHQHPEDEHGHTH